jgi:hypothetical protein
MQLSLTCLQKIPHASLLSGLLTLAACGGGGTTATTYNPAPQPVITVQGSGGDLGKLANARWLSGCGSTIAPDSGQVFVVTAFSMGPVAGTTVPGTITTQRFADPACTTSHTIQQPPAAVKISYTKELVVYGGILTTVQGTADQLLITSTPTGSTSQTFVIAYLPGYTQFLASNNAIFTNLSSTYSKQ